MMQTRPTFELTINILVVSDADFREVCVNKGDWLDDAIEIVGNCAQVSGCCIAHN